jgi:hypothetical protein
LTGYEDDGNLEELFLEYAKRHGYELVHISKKRDLWIPPNAKE